MSDAAAASHPVPEGVHEESFTELLAKGRGAGSVTQEELISVLDDDTELTSDLIDAVIGLVETEGISVVPDDSLVVPADPSDPTDVLEAAGLDLAELDLTVVPEPVVVPPVVAKRPKRVRTAGVGAAMARLSEMESGAPGSADAVKMYLKEIGKVPLLSAGEEVALAQRIESGLEAVAEMARLEEKAAAAGNGGIEAEARRHLQLAIRDGSEAREVLTAANLRLVVSIAKRYRKRGMQFLDLIQEGNIGLMRAVDKFDYTKGFKFSTYATWWIRQAITRAIADQARVIRIPVHMVEIIHKVTRTHRQLVQELGREPTSEELAVRCEMTPERVREIEKLDQSMMSLEQPMGDEDGFSLSDTIEDMAAVMPADAAARAMLIEAVKKALSQLSEREQKVVRLRFGLDDGQMRTLEEVGREFGVTRERIRQIESKTLAKLRHPMRSQPLRDYLDEE